MKFKLNFLLTILLVIAISCYKNNDGTSNKRGSATIYDYNVLIVPDLSNRINPDIHPKPINDTLLINKIVENIDNLLKIKNRQLNQLDIYKLDFINRGILNQNLVNAKNLEINFGRFKNKLKDASNYKRDSLKTDITVFKNNVSKVYAFSLKNTAGSDVWNYFNQTIKSSIINQKEKIINTADENLPIITKSTKNIVILFTDGYIESANNTSGYTLNQKMVNTIKTEFLKSNSNNLEKFIISNPKYLIKKTSNNLQNINILILEVIDRSLDKDGVATIQPTDFEIMKIIWTKWLKDSGASYVEIHPAFSKKIDAYEVTKTFMETIQ